MVEEWIGEIVGSAKYYLKGDEDVDNYAAAKL